MISEEQRLGQPRPLDGNNKERGVCARSGTRRVPQERHGATVATTTRSRGETRRTRTPSCEPTAQKEGVKLNETAMECHGGRLMEFMKTVREEHDQGG